jgi:hypothetical protein
MLETTSVKAKLDRTALELTHLVVVDKVNHFSRARQKYDFKIIRRHSWIQQFKGDLDMCNLSDSIGGVRNEKAKLGKFGNTFFDLSTEWRISICNLTHKEHMLTVSKRCSSVDSITRRLVIRFSPKAI